MSEEMLPLEDQGWALLPGSDLPSLNEAFR